MTGNGGHAHAICYPIILLYRPDDSYVGVVALVQIARGALKSYLRHRTLAFLISVPVVSGTFRRSKIARELLHGI